MANRAVEDAIDEFFARYLTATGGFALAEDDPDEPSPCALGAPDDGMIRWRPVRQSPACALTVLADAMGAPVHRDAVAWLTRWWSLPIEALLGDAHLCLDTPASAKSSARQVARAAGYAHACLTRGAAPAVPLAVGIHGGVFVLRNDTGGVIFERAGRPPRALGRGLGAWLDALTPLAL